MQTINNVAYPCGYLRTFNLVQVVSNFRDAIITCIVNTLTCLIAGVLVFSILGYMAHIQETTIAEVVNSGPGLVFLTYPDLVSAIISLVTS